MFKAVRKIGALKEVLGRDNQCLLIAEEDVMLTLLRASRSRGHIVSILPVNGAKVTLSAPDSTTKINAGDGDQSKVEITGQNIVTLISDGCWYVAGIREPPQAARKVGRPRKTETAQEPQAVLT